jgi:hypothetical protein
MVSRGLDLLLPLVRPIGLHLSGGGWIAFWLVMGEARIYLEAHSGPWAIWAAFMAANFSPGVDRRWEG